jgi:hypothetical protein
MCLRFQFCTHQRDCILHFQKKVKFVVPYCPVSTYRTLLLKDGVEGSRLWTVSCNFDVLHRRLCADRDKIPEGRTFTHILHLSDSTVPVKRTYDVNLALFTLSTIDLSDGLRPNFAPQSPNNVFI